KPENVNFDEFEFKPEFKELAVKLGKTKFEREFSRIIGEGQVRVISPQFLATGQDLVMQYDQINKKLQLLEISQMQKLVVTIKKDKKKTSSQPDNSNSQPDAQKDPTITGPADFMTYYLNLSNDITVQTQQESFTADQLSIMADIASGNDFIEESKKKSNSPDDPAEQLIANNSIDNENYRIITMTCNGPLTITSPDKPYHAPDGLPRLELVASGKPVEIYRNGIESLKADKIIYSRNTDNGNHTIKLISQDKYRNLYLAQDISQTVSAASEISYDFNNNIATLAGPGVINSTINDDNKTKIEFSDTINVKFENAPETEQEKIDIPLNTTRKVEWIECIGTVVATLKEGRFSSQKARINFDITADNTGNNDQHSKTPAVDNMIMSGNVTMTDGLSNFNCDKLILRFKQQNGLSEPVSLWAGGNVKAENDDYIIQSSDRILINFGKQREGKPLDQKKAAPGSETAFSDMDQMFSNLNPVYVIAEGANNGVTFKNKIKNFAVKGSSIEGKLPDIKAASPEPALSVARSSNSLSQDGIWKITGQPAIVQLSENRTVSGSEIELDQASGFCRIPGSGSLNLVTSGKFSGSS
ncbi:MAG: hypothetical protein JXM68_07875, partial [Sedimentisphaerales bacterium]|nr:hypothetical protein [Sedimentisphaerales bacterium]